MPRIKGPISPATRKERRVKEEKMLNPGIKAIKKLTGNTKEIILQAKAYEDKLIDLPDDDAPFFI